MSARPSRATTAGRTYLDLQNLARRRRRPTDELHQLYALEGFLARLATSRYADDFVLKGGVLLAAFDSRRATRDIDLLGGNLSNEMEDVVTVMREIAMIEIDDGLTFNTDNITADKIREDEVQRRKGHDQWVIGPRANWLSR